MPWDATADLFSRIGNALLILMFGSTIAVLLAGRIGRELARAKLADRAELRDAVEQWNRDRPDLASNRASKPEKEATS